MGNCFVKEDKLQNENSNRTNNHKIVPVMTTDKQRNKNPKSVPKSRNSKKIKNNRSQSPKSINDQMMSISQKKMKQLVDQNSTLRADLRTTLNYFIDQLSLQNLGKFNIGVNEQIHKYPDIKQVLGKLFKKLNEINNYYQTNYVLVQQKVGNNQQNNQSIIEEQFNQNQLNKLSYEEFQEKNIELQMKIKQFQDEINQKNKTIKKQLQTQGLNLSKINQLSQKYEELKIINQGLQTQTKQNYIKQQKQKQLSTSKYRDQINSIQKQLNQLTIKFNKQQILQNQSKQKLEQKNIQFQSIKKQSQQKQLQLIQLKQKIFLNEKNRSQQKQKFQQQKHQLTNNHTKYISELQNKFEKQKQTRIKQIKQETHRKDKEKQVQFNKEKEQLNKQLDHLKKNIKEQAQQINKLLQQNKNLLSQNKKLKEQKANLEQQIKKKHCQFQINLQNQKQNNEKQISQNQKEKNLLNIKISELETQLATKSKPMMPGARTTANEQRLKIELEKVRKQTEAKIQKLTNQLMIIKQNHKNLKQDNEHLMREYKQKQITLRVNQQQLNQFTRIFEQQNGKQIHKPEYLIFDRLFNGEMMNQEYVKKIHLKNLIEKKTNRKIYRTKLVYKMDIKNTVNFHEYLDGVKNVCQVIKTKNNIFGGFSTSQYEEVQNQSTSTISFLFTFNPFIKPQSPVTSYDIDYKKPNARSLVYDKSFMIMGNSQIRYRIGDKTIYSNFAIGQAYYDNREQKVEALLMNDQKKQVQIQGFEWYQIIFEENSKQENENQQRKF